MGPRAYATRLVQSAAVHTETISRFELESGVVLREAPVAVRTWGRLNARSDNALLVGHALTGNVDVDAWWSGLLGPGHAFDPERFFVVALGVPGSPYGTVSPLTEDPRTGRPYGPAFPRFTIRDTVALHRRVLERLGVRQAAAAVGGSMGGMQVLEWAFQKDERNQPFVRALVPIAVGGRHTAWQIGWSEAQRQAIYADPNWKDGHYASEAPPRAGLATARMMAMVSYRSHGSFAARFGRDAARESSEKSADAAAGDTAARGAAAGASFAVESYLRYQGDKLTERFDANCYVRLTQQMDTHDVARGRGAYPDVLQAVTQPVLVVGIDTDVLYPLAEQEELAAHLPQARLEVLVSPDGHDAFLIEQSALDALLRAWLAEPSAAPAAFSVAPSSTSSLPSE